MQKPGRFLMCLIVLTVTNFVGSAAPSATKTTISGQIKGVHNGTLQLILEEDINRKKNRVIANISVDENGHFRFEQELAPHVYTLRLNGQRSVVLVAGKGQQIVVTGDANGTAKWLVTGSEDTAKLLAYEEFRKESLNRLVNSLRVQTKELKMSGVADTDPRQTELAALEIENYRKHKDELIQFIKREMGTSLAIYPTSIRWDGEKNIPFLRELSKQFDAAHPGTEIAARVKEKVEKIIANSIGGKAAEIRMPDRSGTLIPLSSIKAKYILIDFWGSWCTPCRQESRLLGELYDLYKPAGFEIYGVGLESEKANWLKAIDQDKRIWTNVSTFQAFETPVTFDYAVTSLPANVLVDSSGRVLARNLHGKQLRAAVEKLFR